MVRPLYEVGIERFPCISTPVIHPQHKHVTDISDDASISLVLTKVAEATGISLDCLGVSKGGGGFPPQAEAISIPENVDVPFAETLGISHTDLLIVNEKKKVVVDQPQVSSAAPPTVDEDEMLARAIAASLGEEVPNGTSSLPGGMIEKGKPAFETLESSAKAVVRRIVPDDNSCLFSSVAYCVGRGRMGASEMRSLVAEAVVSDPIQWNEVILDKDPHEYAAWILDTSKWGGAIELNILSQQLAVEISAFDVQSQRVDTYGEGSGYSKRILVVYDGMFLVCLYIVSPPIYVSTLWCDLISGLHYDALALAAHDGASEAQDITMFSVDDPLLQDVLKGASSLVCRYHDLRQYTDTSKFTLRCNVCQLGLTGEKEAMQHAQASGHQSFSEY